MWSRQWMMRLIIYYVQLDTQDVHDKNYDSEGSFSTDSTSCEMAHEDLHLRHHPHRLYC